MNNIELAKAINTLDCNIKALGLLTKQIIDTYGMKSKFCKIEKYLNEINIKAQSLTSNTGCVDVEGLTKDLIEKCNVDPNYEPIFNHWKSIITNRIKPCNCEELKKEVEWWKKDSAKYQSKFRNQYQFTQKLMNKISQLTQTIEELKKELEVEII